MPSKRYTIIVADRSSGVVRRATISLRPVLVISGLVLSVPVLIGIGAAWKAKSDVANLEASHRALELENASFRSATDELTTQITSLEAAIRDIGARSALDPNVARTMDKLPALVKASAMGGSRVGSVGNGGALAAQGSSTGGACQAKGDGFIRLGVGVAVDGKRESLVGGVPIRPTQCATGRRII